MCAFDPPFYGENLISLGYNIVNKSPKKIPATYSTELADFITKLLDKQPATRPSSKEVVTILNSMKRSSHHEGSTSLSEINLTNRNPSKKDESSESVKMLRRPETSVPNKKRENKIALLQNEENRINILRSNTNVNSGLGRNLFMQKK